MIKKSKGSWEALNKADPVEGFKLSGHLYGCSGCNEEMEKAKSNAT